MGKSVVVNRCLSQHHGVSQGQHPPPATLRDVLSSLGNSSYSYSIILCLKISGDFTKDRKMSYQESNISIREGEKLRHSKTQTHVDTNNQQWNKKLGFFMPSHVPVSQCT